MKRRAPESVVFYPPAKINLYLEVLDRRSDGYHDIETVMSTIDLRDTLYAARAPESSLETTPSLDVPPEKNLVMKAQKALENHTGRRLPAAFRLIKRIPAGAGLGGGSSDAAAALSALNLLYGLGLGRDALATAAAAVGSDVPFFVYGCCALCIGRGEAVTRITASLRLPLVVVYPNITLSTHLVYQNLKRELTGNGKNVNLYAWLAAASRNRPEEMCFFNRLEEAAFGVAPELAEVKGELSACGCPVTMSGSGSAFFVITEWEKAQKVTETAAKHNWKAYTTRTCGGK